jgi:uncharacterized lipoprotein YajG
MRKQMRSLHPACLLLFTLVFAACGAPRQTSTNVPPANVSGVQATATPAPVLTDLNGPDDLKAQFTADSGVPRLILLVSPT